MDRPAALVCPACATEMPLAAVGPWLGSELVCPHCGWTPPRHAGFPLLAPALAESGSDFDPAAFDLLTAIEARHFWFPPRARLLSQLAHRHFPAARTFLEIGCGGGYVTRAVAQAHPWDRILGGEVSAFGLTHALARLPENIELLQMDARENPFRAAFDVIGCFDVLEHIEEDQRVLDGFARALRPGGGVVLAVPQHMWLWSAADTYAHHKRRYARGELEGKCASSGLEVVASLSYATVTLPLMLLSRLGSRGVSDHGAPPRELEPPGWLNSLLRGALQVEVSASLAGLHLPIGGSRIVVARLPA